jgi:hypothetical protein
VSPTAPTFVALNDRLIRSHNRIRQLEDSEAALLAEIRMLRAVVGELTDQTHRPATHRPDFESSSDYVA